MEKINKGFILPSSAYTIGYKQIKYYRYCDKPPAAGDLLYGTIERIGEHSSLENKSGRIHIIHNGTQAVFVFGNRYAPDYYEGVVPEKLNERVDLIARSGLIGKVITKNSLIKDPTQVKILGYICNEQGEILNTRQFPLIEPKHKRKKYPRARMILVCGTTMNSGKSVAAAACCWALNTMGYEVRAAKITGTASLKDILHMNDAGAKVYADFTQLGYPSTFLLPESEIIDIFNKLDLKYANNPDNFWVIELADGINQRETAMLLNSVDVQSRIYKLIFCSEGAFGVMGGLRVLKDRFNLIPDAISGICTSSPLKVREVKEFTHIPVFNSVAIDMSLMKKILLPLL
jgi:hypothetical protein